ncbi:RNA-binding protein [Finegoldia magna]|uniref:KH domain-containing protein n=1 Tax=Finegoldia magna TaxID=1260 RepID=UPI000B91AFD4|nr:KH domain-containing protein [Finegoldia magna]OXZ35597.1 RNA-binding protein [Finegoldia magna]
MEKLVKTIATALVDNKEAVEVTSRQDKHTVIIEIKADSKDLGKIIGKEGKIAKAIRTITKAATIKSGEKVVVDILQ